MNPYKNEPVYRTNVLQFLPELQRMESFEVPALEAVIAAYRTTHHLTEEQLVHPLKMALVQTTRGPALPAVLAGLGKEESLARIDKYLNQYKYRL
jgi:glutamyl/glutaminyl-tRNA synthetase